MSSALSSLVTELQQATAQRYTTAAGFIVLLYDIIITLDDEIRLIWGSPWTLVKVLYLINRYSVPAALLINTYVLAGFAAPMSDEFCYRYLFAIQVVDCLEGTGILGVLLLLRVYALYNRTRKILAFAIFLWCVYVIAPTVISIVSAAQFFHAGTNILYNPILDTCVMMEEPSYLWVVWVPMVVFESVVFTMIVYKTWQHTQSVVRSSLMATIFRDGVLYFGVMLVGEIVNLVAFLTLPISLYFFAVYPNWCFASIMVSRIYLNLRNVTNTREWSTATAMYPTTEVLDPKYQAAQLRQGRGHRQTDTWLDADEMHELDRIAPVTR